MVKELEAIEQFCQDIRDVLGTADMSDEDGIADMLRDVRIRLENIEGKVADLRGRKDDDKPAFLVEDRVYYAGILCVVEDVSQEKNFGQWLYDLKEAYGDGEHLAVQEKYLTAERDARDTSGSGAFFRFIDCHDDEVWVNVKHIVSLCGKEILLSNNRSCSLTADQTDELRLILDARRA